MIIRPYILDQNEQKKELAGRELRVDEEEYAIVRHRKKLYYVADDYQILVTKKLANQQLKYRSADDAAKIKFKKYIEKAEVFYLEVPNAKDLYELANLGVDAAVISLKVAKADDGVLNNLYEQALLLRPRYNLIKNLTYSETRSLYLKCIEIDPFLILLKSRYLRNPLGSSHFNSEMKKAFEFRLGDFYKKSFENLGFASTITKKTAERHLTNNIFFHNAVYAEDASKPVDRDRLTYENKLDNLDEFDWHSVELDRILKKLRPETKIKLKRLGSEAVQRVLSDSEYINLHSKTLLVEKTKNLSSLSAIAFTDDPTFIKRLRQLYNLGLRKIGNLITL